jgi:N6-adenosine-specific RNA methylase IME4
VAGKYRTIVADPPWPYQKRDSTWGGGFARPRRTGHDNNKVRGGVIEQGLPYDVLTVDALAVLPVADLADVAGCRLFLWTTNRYLPDAFGVLNAWGFTYRQTLVWHKNNPPPWSGSVALTSAEFLLVGRNGGSMGEEYRLRRLPSAVIAVPQTRTHSLKPEAFLDMIEQISPGPYLELFARRQRLGWDTWGNEALNHVELAS